MFSAKMTVFYNFPTPNYINRRYAFSIKTITWPHGLNGALFRACKQCFPSPGPCPSPGAMWKVLHNTGPSAGPCPGPGVSQCEYTIRIMKLSEKGNNLLPNRRGGGGVPVWWGLSEHIPVWVGVGLRGGHQVNKFWIGPCSYMGSPCRQTDMMTDTTET